MVCVVVVVGLLVVGLLVDLFVVGVELVVVRDDVVGLVVRARAVVVVVF